MCAATSVWKQNTSVMAVKAWKVAFLIMQLKTCLPEQFTGPGVSFNSIQFYLLSGKSQ